MFTDYWIVLVLNFSVMGNTAFFSAKRLMKRWYLLGLFELSMIFQGLRKKVFCAVRPARATRIKATAIDHILTNRVLENKMYFGIIKTDSSDHFATLPWRQMKHVCWKTNSMKRGIPSENIDTTRKIKWDKVLPDDSLDKAYETFDFIFFDLYDTAFTKKETEIKTHHLQSPWITIDLQKSSKQKKIVYKKFF